MHPEVHWMIYQIEERERQQQLEARAQQRLLAIAPAHRRAAAWSGTRLLGLANWLLRYGQPHDVPVSIR